MPQIRIPLVALAVVIGLLSPTLVNAAPPLVTPGVYQSDVQAGTSALSRWGATLQNTQSIPSLAAKAPLLRRLLFQFDRRFYAMSRYRLSAPDLNNQRARLARTAPAVTDVLSDFLDAVITGDTAKINRLVPRVSARISTFAAAGGA